MIRRRSFLQVAMVLPLVGATAQPAAAAPRAPFVEEGESVDSIIWHLWGERPTAPTGPLYVAKILPWDGVGYPIVLMRLGWREEDREYFDGYYDHEWSNLRRDVPDRLWRLASNRRRYPNVHSYVREQRFGELPRVMRARMKRNRRLGPDAFPMMAAPAPRRGAP